MRKLLVSSPQTVWEPPVDRVYETPDSSWQQEPWLKKGTLSVLEVDTDALTLLAGGWFRASEVTEVQRQDALAHDVYTTHLRSTLLTSDSGRWVQDRVIFFPRTSCEAVRDVPRQFINPREHANVTFVGDKTVSSINSRGYGDKVRTVIEGVRRFFTTELISVEWPDESPLARPITVRVHARNKLDEALDTLDRFDNDWWFDQDFELHKLIGVHLA